MKYYLAYGSNLNKAQMQRRCPDAVAIGCTKIYGYSLVFRRGFLTIELDKNGSVPVGIWQISEADEKRLDRYEGYPKFYRKEVMHINDLPCMVYIMNEGFPIEKPTDYYFYTVYLGYKDFGMDTAPLKKAYEQAKWGDEK